MEVVVVVVAVAGLEGVVLVAAGLGFAWNCHLTVRTQPKILIGGNTFKMEQVVKHRKCWYLQSI